MNQYKPWVIALGAVARRALILCVAAVVPVLANQGPDIIVQALKSNSRTAGLAGVAYLAIEFVQKWYREGQKQA